MNIGLVQINNGFSGASYLPYSVGILQSYALDNLENPEKFNFMLPIFSRVKVDEAVEHLLDADMVFFSLYVWNAQLSLEIARRLKKRKPEVLIFAGGPHVPDNGHDFILKNDFFEAVVHNAGEKPFLALLENLETKDWSKVPSLSYRDSNGNHVQTELAKREKNLFEIPSPYLTGIFDPLIKAYPDMKWLAAWETNRGCPFSCTFCDWGSATQSRVYQFEIERLYQEIDWFRENKVEFVFCCDANFGILKRDYDIAVYAAESKKKYGYPQALSVQNTKNATEKAYAVQKILAESGLNKGVTLALQSTDLTTLKYVKRANIKLGSFEELQYRFTRDGIETYTDMILGMPGETFSTFADGISTVIEKGQHNRIQFGNLSILPNAEMGDPDYQAKFGMEIVESTMINIHGSLGDVEEIDEIQQTVIATNSMPKEDWVKTRAFCWMTSLLHFDKLMQIPFVILHKEYGISYRDLISIFFDVKDENFPIVSEINKHFQDRAEEIQNGGPDYSQSKKWLNIWWPDDELIMIKLCTENKLIAFYEEAAELLKKYFLENNISLNEELLNSCIFINRKSIKLPYQEEDETVTVPFNIWDHYRKIISGKETSLINEIHSYRIDKTSQHWSSWDEWCKKVIWWGNKKGAYIYSLINETPNQLNHNKATDTSTEKKFAGHF